MKTLLCAVVDTVSHQCGVQACTLYWGFGNILKNDKVLPDLSALT
jgi:hypothetical protein